MQMDACDITNDAFQGVSHFINFNYKLDVYMLKFFLRMKK